MAASVPTAHSPRVSVGLPVYNGQKHLPAAIDNLLQQSFQDWELVISDNASTDQTEAICRRYAQSDSRIRYYRAEVNHGLAWNFNRVVGLAEGEYFKWAAYDDLCDSSLIERCVTILDRHPDVIWCHTRTRYIDLVGELIDSPPIGFLEPVRSGKERTPLGSNDSETCPAIPWTRTAHQPHQRLFAVMTGPGEVYDIYGVIRRQAMLKTGLHRPFYGADRIFLAELSLLGRYAEVPGELFFARRHAEQTVFGERADIERQTSGQSNQQWFAPQRVRNAWWMLRLSLQAKINWKERLRCLWMWCLYLLNPSKWNRLRLDLMRRLGFHVQLPEDHIREVAFHQRPHQQEP